MEDIIRYLTGKGYVDEREQNGTGSKWLAQVTKQLSFLHHTMVFMTASIRLTNITTRTFLY
jgi:hypothetical protein